MLRIVSSLLVTLALLATPVQAYSVIVEHELDLPVGSPEIYFGVPTEPQGHDECEPGEVCFCYFGAELVDEGPLDSDPGDGDVTIPLAISWLYVCMNF